VEPCQYNTTTTEPSSEQMQCLIRWPIWVCDSYLADFDWQVMAVDFAANTPRELPIKGGVKSNERFHRLAWGGLSSTPSMPYGILAGGMVDGGIGLWNPAAMMKCED
jgi:hypothetical protein